MLKYSDFVFCNEDEGSKYAESQGLSVDDHVGAAKIIAASEKEVKTRPRIVVITMGKQPTLVVTCMPGEDPVVEEVPVNEIDQSKIVDTNGAGDSLVGAFFSSLVQGKSVVDSIKDGNELAGKII